ncbi:nucleoside-diphosphate sugar epimerase/dehydratase [Litchfieldella xinjiangensis]|uniref:nucleoside-diphosphate sugar epimerase/dehydratase n=1 Tax=Litchfieldella xinjiangensis TaxID=1166948 RepID=UPI0005B7EBF6|nr:hypothetical protein [Halomonas xinjiangensis]
MKTLISRLRSLGGRSRDPLPLIICGLGYPHYQLQARLAGSRRYKVIALLDDYPWNHGTHVEGVRVYYPSEAPSLVQRHGIVATAFCEDSDLMVIDADLRQRLEALGAKLVRLDPDDDGNLDACLDALLLT